MRISLATTLVVAMTGVASAQSSSEPTPALKKWVDGLNSRKEGLERLEAKVKKFAGGPRGNTSGAAPRSLTCQVALAFGLMNAAVKGHIIDENNNDVFYIVIAGTLKNESLGISYIYNSRGALLLTAINTLPTDWKVGFQPGDANYNKFAVFADDKVGCIFNFDSSDPFGSWATADESK